MKTYSKRKNSRARQGGAAVRRRRCRGATMVEVMFSILLLSILFVAAVAAVKHPRALVIDAARKQAAIHAADQVLEEVVSRGYSLAASKTLNLSDRFTLNGSAPLSGSLVVDRVAASGSVPEFKYLTVTVGYPGDPSAVVLTTIMTPGGDL
ncbi:prepilin-type N-terminal cleavage/methylation domain-containing protein [Pontiella sp.]|uniref:type IV pilus modification PilV family protein n=1 Tax=Pontiella sp. TaxID=2837462 RepID=UPI0035640967